MAMIVKHNLQAMNSNRMLGVNMSSQAKSTEKLSSGYKINRAADDAAGLSISEKMRKQIRGLTQASLNAQDGISAVQTAEGALNEVQDMLQRMNELAVKAANGTNSETDRSYIQSEIDQLVTEIDRVSETTKFNETYLLKGNADGKSGATAVTANVGANTANNIIVSLAANKDVELGDYALGTVKLDTTVTPSPTTAISAATVDAKGTTELNAIMDKSNGSLVFKAAGNAAGTTVADNDEVLWNVYQSDGTTAVSGTTSYTTAQLKAMGIGITYNTTAAAGISKGDTLTVKKTMVTSVEQTAKLNAAGISVTNNADPADYKNVAVGSDFMVTVKNNAAGEATISAYDKDATAAALKLSLHVGADSTSDNKIALDIKTMSAKGLGLRTDSGAALKVDGKDSTNADAAIDTIAAAIQKVSTQRSALGAIQNRLEHTIANLDNVVENTTAAESQIRDTDMATEMVKYSNNQILAQAGQAMLAQANQANQGVLSLLQ